MSLNKKIKLEEDFSLDGDQNTVEPNDSATVQNYSTVKIKEEIGANDYDYHTLNGLNQIDYTEDGTVVKMKEECVDTNIDENTGNLNTIGKEMLINEVPIKSEITFEPFRIADPSEVIADNGETSICWQKTDDMDIKPNIDELHQDEGTYSTISHEEIHIKDEIMVEEAKVEQFSENENIRRILKCHLCEYCCFNQNSLWKHQNVTHPEEATTRCLICYQKFQGSSQLEKHIEDEHQGFGNKCTICSAFFKKGKWSTHKAECPGMPLYVCIICKQKYMKKAGLFKHLDEHFVPEALKESLTNELRVKEQFYRCIFCEDDKAYKIGLLKTHAKDLHDGYYLECPDCKKTFRDQGYRNNHVNKFCKLGPAIKLNDGELECSKCSKRFKNTEALENHLNKHKKCKFCAYHCTSKTSLWKHVNTVHAEENTTCCTICYKKFIGSSQLAKHIEDEHQGCGARCKICSTLCKKDTLNEHKNQCPGKLLFICDTCEEYYVTKEGLFKHMDEHAIPEDLKQSSIREYKIMDIFLSCAICKDDKAYKTGPLKAHANEHHNGHHLECPDCELTFNKPYARAIHMRKYCKAGPGREKYQQRQECPECSQSCRNKTALENHMAAKHSTASYYCEECDIKFPNAITMGNHKVKFHTKRSFNCSFCSKTFFFESSLRLHTKQHVKEGDIVEEPQQSFEDEKCSKQFSNPVIAKKHEKQPNTDNPNNSQLNVEEKTIQEKSKPTTNKKRACKFCDACFGSAQSLLNHIKKVHPEDGAARCNICHVSFQGTSQLEKHITDDHQGLGYKCDICLTQYKKGTEHKIKCPGRLLFKCGRCEMLYATKEGLLKHLNEHGLQEYLKEASICETRIKENFLTCEICEDYKAYRKEPYWKHIKDLHFGHHVRCPDCGKTFQHSSSRITHLKKSCSSTRERYKV